MKATFKSSAGWKEKPKIIIHLFAPPDANPMPGTKTRSVAKMEKIKK